MVNHLNILQIQSHVLYVEHYLMATSPRGKVKEKGPVWYLALPEPSDSRLDMGQNTKIAFLTSGPLQKRTAFSELTPHSHVPRKRHLHKIPIQYTPISTPR